MICYITNLKLPRMLLLLNADELMLTFDGDGDNTVLGKYHVRSCSLAACINADSYLVALNSNDSIIFGF